MSRYTIKNLRELVNQANEANPHFKWGNDEVYFFVNCAYGGYQVTLCPKDSKKSYQVDFTYGHYSARETANKFKDKLLENKLYL